jgi:predicted methyltransferase
MKKLISVLAAAALMCGQAFAIDEVRLAAALNSAERSDADKALDAARQPIAVLSFLGLEEGMTVMDVMASGGWYTEVLSHAVGPQGKVLMHNNPASLARGTTAETVNNRVNGRLNNVERVENTFDQLGVAPASVDLAITHLNFHDVYNANPDNAMAMLAAIKEALKSGGILGIADHRGNLGADNTALHRIPLDTVAKAATDAGFYVVGVSDALYVDSDPRTAGPFDESLGRNTDRILLKLMKP